MEGEETAAVTGSRAAGRPARLIVAMRVVTLALLIVVLAQYAVGMVVNLFATIPLRHPGARPPDYFSGSASSVAWAIAHGPVALAVHAALGLALVIAAIAAAVLAGYLGRWQVTTAAWLAAACVLGAGFNGASFLDFNANASSLIMALLAAVAIACYAAILYALPAAAITATTAPPTGPTR